jgi:hypothetical protein
MARGGNFDEIEVVADHSGDDSAGEKNEDPENNDKAKRRQKIKFNESDGARTLDKPENINLSCFDVQHLVDPLFKKTTRMFDEMSLSTLLTSQLHCTSSLLLQLDSNIAREAPLKIQKVDSGKHHLNSLLTQAQSIPNMIKEERAVSQDLDDFMTLIYQVCDQNAQEVFTSTQVNPSFMPKIEDVGESEGPDPYALEMAANDDVPDIEMVDDTSP